nr:GNAT family N-acetyltransferase [Mucilaginibacter sp. L294]
MTHILDNPIYNALKTGNKKLSIGDGQVTIFRRDVAPFAGMESNSNEDFEALTALGPQINPVVIFSPVKHNLPGNWEILREFEMLQMVHEGPAPTNPASQQITDLDDSHIAQMIELTQLTKPGPFLQRTIEFGNYTGIFDDGKLVSMVGQRMQPSPYIELSAVCTHPDHLGKGYAGILLNEQIKRVIKANGIPFLHVLADNESAIRVYERVGFKARSPMFGYVINIQE